MNSRAPIQSNAVKIYVFIDTLKHKNEYPLLVIINRYKQVADLRKEFAVNHKCAADEQYWIINSTCCPDEVEISELIEDVDKFKNGYIAYLVMVTREEINKIPKFIDTYLEERYARVDPYERWQDPIDDAIIIADKVDPHKPLPVIGWTCEGCTIVNKAFLEWCNVCGLNRPVGYKIPKNYIYTKEDNEFIFQQRELEKKQKKMESELKLRQEIEKTEYRKKLELLYKEKVAYTTEESECPICVMDYPAGEAIILHSCHHTVCKDCLKGYLTTVTDPRVKCPTENCVGILEDGEISGVLTEEEYKKYDELNLRTAEAKTANTFHCKTPNCQAWVVYDDDVNFFDCPLCLKKNCLLCAAIHEPQTCKEYQEELAINARNDEAARKDMEFLDNMIKKGEAMKCPGCKIIVQKKSGCDWMQCNMCKTEICWATKGPRWGPKGRGDVSGGCGCNYLMKRCSPTCGNCH